MNVRRSILALLAPLLVAATTTVCGAESNIGAGVQCTTWPAPNGVLVTTCRQTSDVSALTDVAANLAQRAATMANEGNPYPATTQAPAPCACNQANQYNPGQWNPATSETSYSNSNAAYQTNRPTELHTNGQLPWRSRFDDAEDEIRQLKAELANANQQIELIQISNALATAAEQSQPTEQPQVAEQAPEQAATPAIPIEAQPFDRTGGITLTDGAATEAGIDVSFADYVASDEDEYVDPVAYHGRRRLGQRLGCIPLFWTAGTEATFLYPDLNDGNVSFQVIDTVAAFDETWTSGSSAIEGPYAAPRVWLGVQGCKWGVQARYWHLQGSEADWDDYFDANSLSINGTDDLGYWSFSRVEAYTFDLELTRRFCIHNCWLQASVGARHGRIEADAGISAFGETNDGLISGYARSNRTSHGTGVVVGLYGRTPLFPCSCVHVFYNLHWSVLWGCTATWAETEADFQETTNPGATAGSVNGASTLANSDLSIAELQIGLEWDYPLVCMPANAFFRIAGEYQRWDGGPGSSVSQSFAGVTGGPATTYGEGNASALAPAVDFFGLAVGAGLTW